MSLVALVMSAATLIVVIAQTQANQDEARAAVAAFEAQTRMTDLQSIGSIVLSYDASGLTIENRGEFSAPPVGVWLLSRDGGNEISQITGALGGLPACSTTKLPADLLRSARTDGPDDDTTFDPNAAVDREASIVVQGPSGAWFLLSDIGYFSSIDTDDSIETPLARVEPYDLPFDPLEVLRDSPLWNLSADTYWEGADSVHTYSLEASIAFPGAVSEFGASVLVDRTSSCAVAR